VSGGVIAGRRRLRILRVFVAACFVLLSAAAVAVAKAPKPSTSPVTVTPSSVTAPNGWVTVSATVAEAASCEFSAKPAVAGLPATVPCSAGAVSETINLPRNEGKKPAKYTFHVRVSGPGGARNAKAGKATVSVGAGGVPDRLTPGSTLEPGAFLLSPNDHFELVMQTDGNLVLYNTSSSPKQAVWSSQTSGAGNYLKMQTEGNLVVYSAGDVPQWNTVTFDFPGAYLQLQDDGSLVLYHDGHAIWTYGYGYKGHIVNEAETLEPGAFLLSPNHRFELVMQTDGNLVLYNASTSPKQAVWSSQTSGAGNYLKMQTEGNVVVYSAENAAQWNTVTFDFPGAYLQLQDDGNLVLYHDGHAIWTYGSEYKGQIMNGGEQLQPGAFLLSPSHHFELVMQVDGNLVLYNTSASPKQALWSSQTSGAANYLAMQGDGNLVVYDSGNVARWNSGTGGHPGAFLQLQDDDNLVIYENTTALWDWAHGRLAGGGGGGGTATVGMPFSGKWAYGANVNPPYTDENSSHPAVHTPSYGDWATDLYAGQGTPVTLSVSAPGSVSFGWIARTNGSCGERRVVAVYVDGLQVGSIYYEHMASAASTASPPTNGMTVGYVHTWGSCNPGPHVHVELKNVSNYACWVDHGHPGTTVTANEPIGRLGSPNTGPQQACGS
jgi:stress response protein SCP2